MNPHLAPWYIDANGFPDDGYASDQLEFLIGYAILAPSHLNTQPWLFRINAMDLELFADRRRAIRVVDPEDRELTISCGAALFNLRTATEYFGHLYAVEPFPEPSDSNLVARLRIGLSGETSSEDILLFQAITQRRTNRGPFRQEPLPQQLIESLTAAAQKEGAWLHIITSEPDRAAVADMVCDANRILWADKAFRKELACWIRTNPDRNSDGIQARDADIPNWLAFAAPTLVRLFNRGNSIAEAKRGSIMQSPALAIIGTVDDNPTAWLSAGQALENVLLRARTEGVWASFLNEAIEVPEIRAQLAETFQLPGYPQVLLRLGYGPEPALPTPRRHPRELLIKRRTSHHQH
ncbi:MAG: nitroreductase family protein [Verrucomicrobiae bacterium]|nr:nitroreductase family protein [Verrucomicrobiae bacterium]